MSLNIKFVPLTCAEFAVECDWNNQNSQKFQNLCFSEKKMGFARKFLNFSKIAKYRKFAQECVYNCNISWKCVFTHHYDFWLPEKKIKWTLEKLENRLRKSCLFLRKKTFWSFRITSLQNREGAKYPGDSRLCFLTWPSRIVSLLIWSLPILLLIGTTNSFKCSKMTGSLFKFSWNILHSEKNAYHAQPEHLVLGKTITKTFANLHLNSKH